MQKVYFDCWEFVGHPIFEDYLLQANDSFVDQLQSDYCIHSLIRLNDSHRHLRCQAYCQHQVRLDFILRLD
jgi:hypothetical protein